jgi:hypothetical protein
MPFQNRAGWQTFFEYGKEGRLVPDMISYARRAAWQL